MLQSCPSHSDKPSGPANAKTEIQVFAKTVALHARVEAHSLEHGASVAHAAPWQPPDTGHVLTGLVGNRKLTQPNARGEHGPGSQPGKKEQAVRPTTCICRHVGDAAAGAEDSIVGLEAVFDLLEVVRLQDCVVVQEVHQVGVATQEADTMHALPGEAGETANVADGREPGPGRQRGNGRLRRGVIAGIDNE
jgi:hypothetical protein